MKKLLFLVVMLAIFMMPTMAVPFDAGPPVATLTVGVDSSAAVVPDALVTSVDIQGAVIGTYLAQPNVQLYSSDLKRAIGTKPSIYCLDYLSVPTLAGLMYGVDSILKSNIASYEYVNAFDPRARLLALARDQTTAV